MPEACLTWEADEIRNGTRKIPGYAGHVSGVQHKVGLTFGCSSAEVLGPNSDHHIRVTSAILGHRHDGYTTPGHPSSPFKEDIYRKRPSSPGEQPPRIIPGYAGHRPGWHHTHGKTMGTYADSTLQSFTQSTRRQSKTLRVKTAPADIFALPDPPKPPPTIKLYDDNKSYLPHTTCYAPAIRERFGHSFSTLTRQAFIAPNPRIAQPLLVPEDGVAIDHLALPAGYGGYIPRVLPKLYHSKGEGTMEMLTTSLT
mmetsp:Transcript_18796/g.38171  ORF Transcript_18796/g.38171 Transcript_18796/m.38171 type:complete len:254 (-) Transcript_18796:55-816(-)